MSGDNSQQTMANGSTGSSTNRRNVLKSLGAGAGAITVVGSASTVGAYHRCDYAIRPVFAPDLYWNADRAYDAVESLVYQINEYTDKSATMLDSKRTDVEPFGDQDDECDYFEKVANELEENGLIKHNDMLLIGHKHVEYGFGGMCDIHTNDYNFVTGGLVYCGDGTKYQISKNIGIQELLHYEPWNLDHEDGLVVTKDETIKTVSPLATSYTYDRSDQSDTMVCGDGFSGTADPPDNFCWTNPYENGEGAWTFDCPVHDDGISYCARRTIEDDDGEFSTRFDC